MSKVININGMAVKVIDNTEKQDNLSQEDKDMDIRAFQHRGYFATLTSLEDYFNASMELLDYDKAHDLLRPEWPIYTRTTDACPTQYFESAKVNNSFVSNGCLIEGTIDNSIIGRSVTIKKGAVIKNSIILNDVHIGDNCYIENCIVESRDTIKANTVHTGEAGNPKIVIEKSFRYTL